MWNAGLDESQAGIKITRRNINNIRYADDTTLNAGSEEEIKSLLVRVKEEREKADLKLNIHKTKIIVSSPITSLQVEGEKLEAVTDFTFLGFIAQSGKESVCNAGDPVLFLGWEDHLEKEMATHSSILA